MTFNRLNQERSNKMVNEIKVGERKFSISRDDKFTRRTFRSHPYMQNKAKREKNTNGYFSYNEYNYYNIHNDDLMSKYQPGTRAFVRTKEFDSNCMWHKAKVVKCSNDCTGIFVRIKYETFDMISSKYLIKCDQILVNKQNIALAEPSLEILPIRTQVVTALTSGFVLETPSHKNNNRYLIIFENGLVSYCETNEVFQVEDGHFTMDKIKNHVSDDLKYFLLIYFEKCQVDDILDRNLTKWIEFNAGSSEEPRWIPGRIISRYSSIMTVSFRSQVRRNSSFVLNIHKSSLKLKHIHYLFYPLIKQMKRPNPSTYPYITSNKQNKCISYKSTRQLSRKSDGLTTNFVKKYLKIYLSKIKPNLTCLYTYKYISHICTPSCMNHSISLLSLRGQNCFLLPNYFGFKRIDTDGRIFYQVPCGRYLNSLDEVEYYLLITNCALDVDNFTFDPISIDNEKIYEEQKCINYEKDISNGEEAQPIPVINFINDDEFDKNFTYISNRIVRKDMQFITNGSFQSCCDCDDNCIDPDSCACIQLTLNRNYFSKLQLDPNSNKPLGYIFKRLVSINDLGIYECNSNCSCNNYCSNRVVQNGIKCVLQIFKTQLKGWGVRTLYDIPRGTFVCTYSAPVVKDETIREFEVYNANLDFIDSAELSKEGYEESVVEIDQEEAICDSINKSNGGSENVDQLCSKYSLRRRPRRRVDFGTMSSNSRTKKPKSLFEYFPDTSPFVLDARKCGNVGRFFNHSCDPNMIIQNVFIDTHDLRLPHVAFFTNRLVRAMEELTWDYNYEIGSLDDKKILCLCGSSDCRGRLL